MGTLVIETKPLHGIVNLFVLNLVCFISVCPYIPETGRLENTYSCCGFWLWSWLAAVVNLFVLKLLYFISVCPGSSEVPRNPLTRWDVSSIPANGFFLTKKLKTKMKMPNGWRTIKSLVHKIRLHGRRGKGMAESSSREKLRHAPQKEGG